MAKEYIEREEALKGLEDSGIGFYDDEPIQTRNRALKIIQNIPAADVEEVVRCKDCIHLDRVENESESWFYCKLNAHDRYEGFFCAAGERRGNDGSA